MNIQERIEALETEFAEKIKALKAEVQREDEFPQDGDEYWFVNYYGSVDNSFYTNHPSDNYRSEIGNFFKTKQEAQFAVEKLKVEAELRKFSRPFEHGKPNFNLIFNKDNGLIIDAWNIYWCQGAIHFESKEKAKQAIESVGEERIKKYIFGVE